ncbi:MAG: hypothetical protein ACFHHU_00360 [Porticoccaceae bacterium]
MMSKIRLMICYYLAVFQWPFRSYWRWGMFIKAGEYRDSIELSVEVDANTSTWAVVNVNLQLTAAEVFQIFRCAYLSTSLNSDFVQIGKKVHWQGANEPVEMDKSVLRVGPDFLTLIGYANGEIQAMSADKDLLLKVFDHFGLPMLKTA